MKRFLFIVLALIVSQHVSAQFNKGRILAGGSIGFSSNTSKSKVGSTTTTNGTSTALFVSPNAGYFVADNIAVGAAVNLGTSKYNPESNTQAESTQTDISLTPFARYYLDPGIFFQGSFGFGTRKSKSKLGSVTNESTDNLTSWSLGAGYAYFLNDNVAIEPLIGYRSSVTKFENDNKAINGTVFLSVGLQVYLGARN